MLTGDVHDCPRPAPSVSARPGRAASEEPSHRGEVIAGEREKPSSRNFTADVVHEDVETTYCRPPLHQLTRSVRARQIPDTAVTPARSSSRRCALATTRAFVRQRTRHGQADALAPR
jgi:hypothetical protein